MRRSPPSPPFRAEPDEVSITRMIDASSPILLQYCLETKPFETVVMVKRARRGTQGKLSVVLRMEFKKVWIRAIDWDDGNTVTEELQVQVHVGRCDRMPSSSRTASRTRHLIATWKREVRISHG